MRQIHCSRDCGALIWSAAPYGDYLVIATVGDPTVNALYSLSIENKGPVRLVATNATTRWINIGSE